MSFSHLKLKILDGRYKYVLLESPVEVVELAARSNHNLPSAFFITNDEASAVVSEDLAVEAKLTEAGWVCVRVVGEMPFGTVSGLIANISTVLKSEGIGICAVSTFLTDWFFIKSQHLSLASAALNKAGWELLN